MKKITKVLLGIAVVGIIVTAFAQFTTPSHADGQTPVELRAEKIMFQHIMAYIQVQIDLINTQLAIADQVAQPVVPESVQNFSIGASITPQVQAAVVVPVVTISIAQLQGQPIACRTSAVNASASDGSMLTMTAADGTQTQQNTANFRYMPHSVGTDTLTFSTGSMSKSLSFDITRDDCDYLRSVGYPYGI